VDGHANPQSTPGALGFLVKITLNDQRRFGGFWRSLENRPEPVTNSVEDVPTVGVNGIENDLVVALEVHLHTGSILFPQTSATLDVREEERDRSRREISVRGCVCDHRLPVSIQPRAREPGSDVKQSTLGESDLARFDSLYTDDGISVLDWHCAGTDDVSESSAPAYGFAFPRQGVFRKVLGHQEVTATPGAVLFFQPSETFQTSHPMPGGDRGTVVRVDEPMIEEIVAAIGAEGVRVDLRSLRGRLAFL
jgi:hypothetical protein